MTGRAAAAASAKSAGASRGALVAWALYDFANSAYATVIQTFVFAAYFTRQVASDEQTGTTQWGLAVGIAGLLVALGGPILGAAADQGGQRKPWLVFFTLVCVAASALLWFIEPHSSNVALALALVVLATLAVEFASIFYNAMLPTLVPSERIGRWSGWGWALGYLGGLACLAVTLLVLIRPDPPLLPLDPAEAEPVRASFVLVALWYLLFALPLFYAVPGQERGKPLVPAVRDGLRQLINTLRHVREYSDLARFLIARMIYIDGLATLFAFGGVYAVGTFGMSEQDVLIFGIALNVSAGLGAAAFAWIDDYLGGKRTILLSLIGLIVPSAIILFVEETTLFWLLGIGLGIFVGPAQAASRSYLARMAPSHLTNEMFGLFALSGKATAFAGPLLVGGLTWISGSQRVGMSAILAFFVVGFALMLTVPGDHRAAARR